MIIKGSLINFCCFLYSHFATSSIQLENSMLSFSKNLSVRELSNLSKIDNLSFNIPSLKNNWKEHFNPSERKSNIGSIFNKLSELQGEDIKTPNSEHFISTIYNNSADALKPMYAFSKSSPSEKCPELVANFTQTHPVHLWDSLGLYGDEYLNVINCHWLKFEASSSTVHYVLAGIYIIMMTVGYTGNLLVIFLFVRCRSLRTPAMYLVMNLAVSDFAMMAKMPIFIINSYYQGPVFGAIGCKIYGFVGGLTGTASIMTLLGIALDRYYVITYPLGPLKDTVAQRVYLMILGIWIYAVTFSSIPLFGLNAYTSEGLLTSCSFDYLSDKVSDRVFVFIFFVAAWVIPMAGITFSYIKIYKVVKKAKNMEAIGQTQRHDSRKQKAEVKVAWLSLGIIILWCVAWTPYAILALLGIFNFHSLIIANVSVIPALTCKLASCIDPFVYALSHPRVRREVLKLFRCGDQRSLFQRRGMELSQPMTLTTFHAESRHSFRRSKRESSRSIQSPATPKLRSFKSKIESKDLSLCERFKEGDERNKMKPQNHSISNAARRTISFNLSVSDKPCERERDKESKSLENCKRNSLTEISVTKLDNEEVETTTFSKISPKLREMETLI